MNVSGKAYRSIWPSADGTAVEIIDQTQLPHAFVTTRLATLSPAARADAARQLAVKICDEDVVLNRALAAAGLPLIRTIAAKKKPGERVNILTHCNAGWLCAVDVGTATAPIYAAHDAGIPVHVWVDETRPRNQGAS